MIKTTRYFLSFLLLTGVVAITACDSEEEEVANSAPWADAGVSISTSVALETYLDGTGSYDPDEADELKYHWLFESVPEGSAITAEDLSPNDSADAAEPMFIADMQGLYVLRLHVNDGLVDSKSDFVHVMADIEGSLPIADAGDDQAVTEGDTVNLDGSGSSDPLGNELTYGWYLVSVPTYSTLISDDISNADQAGASFVPDAPGVFLLGLQVSNGTQDSVPDFVSVDVTSTNQCPEAFATSSGDLYSCTSIDVSGATSNDPDGDALDFSWRHLLSPYDSLITEADFDDPYAEATTFFADKAGTYTLQVSVNDGECESTPYQFDVEITVRPTNTGPTAVAAGDSWVADFATCQQSGNDWYCANCDSLDIELTASASSDPDGDPLFFEWEALYGDEYPSYQPAQVDDPNLETTIVELQDAWAVYGQQTSHQYMVQLTVTDCMGEEDSTNFSIVYGCTGQ